MNTTDDDETNSRLCEIALEAQQILGELEAEMARTDERIAGHELTAREFRGLFTRYRNAKDRKTIEQEIQRSETAAVAEREENRKNREEAEKLRAMLTYHAARHQERVNH